MKKILFVLLGVLLFTSCASVEKYNRQIAEMHSPTALHEDIDESYEILKRLHPRLYRFVSKDSLDLAFQNLKLKINKPMSSIDFYKELAPVIAKIRQGHTSVAPPFKKMTKKEKKEKGKRFSPFKRVKFVELKDKIYIEKVYKEEDSTLLVGSELIAVDNESVSDLYKSYDPLFAGDGYNTTFLPKYKGLAFGSFYQYTHNLKDSIQLTLKFKESIYTHFLLESYSKLQKEKEKKEPKE
jgi:hypothetical protein